MYAHKLKVFFLVSLLPCLLRAETFYVSNNGNDNNNGTSETGAWKTISKINRTAFRAGDSVLFNNGSVWREVLEISSSGNDQDFIIYGSYGNDDNKPALLGSEQISTWTKVSGNIWSSNQSINRNPMSIAYGAQIFFISKQNKVSWGKYRSSTSDLTSEFEWAWSSNTIYIYSDTDPNSVYKAVECPQRENQIIVNSNSYFKIDNLFIGFLASAGIRDTYGDVGGGPIHVTNCEIAYIGTKNSSLAFGLSVTHSNAYYAYNAIHDCGRRAISINLYATQPVGTMKNVLIEGNHFYNGFHTTGVDCINSGNHTIENIIIRNNFFEGDPNLELNSENTNSNHVYIANQTDGSGVIRNVYVYNNIFTHMHGKGVGLEKIETAYIINNTFYGWNPTLSNGQGMVFVTGSYGRDINIMNNIFYHNKSERSNPALMCIFISNAGSMELNIDNNLYYATDPNTDIIEFYQSGSGYFDDEYTMSQWGNYRHDYPGYDANSIVPQEPLFKDPDNKDFSLLENSPARGAGKSFSWIEADMYSFLMNNPPDLGAVQYGSIPVIPGEIDWDIEDDENYQIGVYPNPANMYFKLVFKEDPPSALFILKIYDVQGRLVREITNPISVSEPVNIEDIPSGLYFIECIFEQNIRFMNKIMIKK